MGVFASLIDRSISGSFSSNASSVDTYAFFYCTKLSEARFPAALTIGTYAFYNCTNLTSVYFPVVESIDDYAFRYVGLVNVSLPNVTSIGDHAFQDCSNLETITVGTRWTTSVCALGKNAFKGCSMLSTIYVPSSLVDSYKSASSWSDYTGMIKAAPKE